MRNYSEEYHEDVMFYCVDNDSWGSPRYVVHFLAFLDGKEDLNLSVEQSKRAALNRARKLGFRKYRAKWFGGGFVISTSRNLDAVARDIKKMYGTKLIY